MTTSLSLWIGFNLFVLAMLALDLGVFHRKEHEVKMKEALTWSAVWIALALLFCGGIFFFWQELNPASTYTNTEAGLAFLTGYVVEKSLSVDNVFVFVVLFGYFHVPAKYQHRVLFWGILGALIMRAIFIAAGVALITKFHWMIYLFGAFLIITGIRMIWAKDKQMHPERNPVLRLFRKLFPVTKDFEGKEFFVQRDGRWWATPLAVVLLLIETTDVIFAVDSIPAILAITQDPFLVYTSNVFAILGLRALYFALAGIMQMFHYLHYGLSAILMFVGTKMLLADVYKVPLGASLGVIFALLAIAVTASLLRKPKPADELQIQAG
jgi:tellurite resistance protein TerC